MNREEVIKKAQKILDEHRDATPPCDEQCWCWAMDGLLFLLESQPEQRGEIERLQDLFRQIQKVYPPVDTPKPDLEVAREVLKENGLTLEPACADNMLTAIDGVREIIEVALKGDKP